MSRIGDRGEMEAFVRSVELGSFSAAARELKLTPSALSKLVTRLEQSLRVRLLTRSTRNVAPTPEGLLFLARCRRILAEIEDAETEVGRSRERPRGRLRMHMGVGFGISQGVSKCGATGAKSSRASPTSEPTLFGAQAMARLSGLFRAEPTGSPVARSIVLRSANTVITLFFRSTL